VIDSLEENGYEFYFDFEDFPPIGRQRDGIKCEVFVTRIYDRQGGNKKIYDDTEGCHKFMGHNHDEAFKRSAESARAWAKAQPAR